jgi:hypothetical protein
MGEYTRNKLLHVGISDSNGFVSHLPANAVVHADSTTWRAVVSIPLPLADHVDDRTWDLLLAEHAAVEQDDIACGRQTYQQLNNNCFDYCLRFLNNKLSYGQQPASASALLTKEALVVEHGVADAIAAVEQHVLSSSSQQQWYPKL